MKDQTMSDLLTAILHLNDIDPEKVGGSGQTALQYLEGVVAGALDNMEPDVDDGFLSIPEK